MYETPRVVRIGDERGRAASLEPHGSPAGANVPDAHPGSRTPASVGRRVALPCGRMGETAPRVIRIGDDSGRTALMVDGVVQSISPEDGLVDGGYWAAMLPDDRPRQALILGLGGATLARLLQARWGAIDIVGVDDDAAILETARSAGWLPEVGLEVIVSDAFTYVHACEDRFDYVAVDLFRGERMPGRVFGKPFLRGLRALVQPHGRVAINVFRDRRQADRIQRIAAFFDIRAQLLVGGNLIIHARRHG